jgi:hypothetical protein
MIRKADGPDEILEKEYEEAKTELRGAERLLKEAETAHADWSGADIAAQLQVDPHGLASKLFDGTLAAHEVRAVLAQLFPRFVFVGRETRFVARFELQFAAGVAVAWLSGSAPQVTHRVRMGIRLESSAKRPVSWRVSCEAIETLPDDDEKDGAGSARWCGACAAWPHGTPWAESGASAWTRSAPTSSTTPPGWTTPVIWPPVTRSPRG